ncbi:prolyl oligopeptidase family serine peptidase [Flagellimonas sp. CMM7]|uniref:prolyl oligopeptidase family serine peptidase n=1 Tax=Flagellimonas sp. CMM7 TaxID=2654676 RepID=UPI0013D84943|nr:prolyl oligopeptidase family serine peptidase [Flagellimonas sp. CMM7]UII81109.1 prolyl oligopeptidase family serine peptidase [Flagellimonas sp. CMM7]
MKRKVLFIGLMVSILFGCKQNETRFFNYPKLANERVVEKHYGISYANEYSNLEKKNDSNIVKWFKDQDLIAEEYFNRNPNYKKLYSRYDSLENKETDPARKIKYDESGLTFYLSKTNEGEILLFVKNREASPQLLYDPKNYKDGTYIIEYYKPSYDGKYVAISMGKDGNFFNETILLDCESKRLIGKPIVNTKPLKAGGIVWTPDSKCISFIAYPNYRKNQNDRNSYTALYCLDNPDKSPKTIFKDGENGIVLNQEYYPVPMFRSSESSYMFIYTGNASDFWDCYYITVQDFYNGNYNWKKLYSSEDNIFHDWGTERNGQYFYKRLNESNIELCVVDLNNPDFKNPKVLFSGKGDSQLSGFEVTRNQIYYTVTTNGIETSLYKYKESSKDVLIKLPISAGEITFQYRSPYSDDLWVKIYGWTSNPKDYYLDPNTGEFKFVELGMWPNYPEFENIISEVVEVESHDGTKIPMSIVRRKDHKRDATSMGIITAYGAYGISETPWFHSPIADFVSQGNIYVSAHVRGGGEKGPKWHDGGMKSTKENSWKDLIACSEYLIKSNYIHPKRLGLTVNSAGGITGGMAVNERPDLFGVFTGFVPILNVIRTEYLDDFDDSDTAFEFGTIKEEKSYKDLLKMDPVVNLSDQKNYPSTLMIIGFNDYLIPPSGPGKYISLLQSFNQNNDKPYLLDVKFDAEHEIDWLNDYARMLFFTMTELKNRN